MSNKARIREEAKKLNPVDDLMFRKMAEEREFCQEILRVILEDPQLTVPEQPASQHTLTNLQGRSVILDLLCITGSGTHVNVEVQKSDNDDHQKRIRYHGSLLTANTADPGIKFRNVPDVCVVYISRFDMFREGRALYHVDRVVRESGKTVSNGFREVYVNAGARDGSGVAALMEVFVDDGAYSDSFPVTSAIKRRYKETEEGQRIMCGIMEQIAEQERNEGMADINRLNAILIDTGRIDDLKRAAKDRDFQIRLMKEIMPDEL